MTITVDIDDAERHLRRWLELVHAGEEIILSKAGQPHARLMPLAPGPAPRRPGRLKGQIDMSAFFDPLTGGELDSWNGR